MCAAGTIHCKVEPSTCSVGLRYPNASSILGTSPVSLAVNRSGKARSGVVGWDTCDYLGKPDASGEFYPRWFVQVIRAEGRR